ncbi:MAG: hypothetical protein ACRC8S_08425 [Fimbriiglobus sp.]
MPTETPDIEVTLPSGPPAVSRYEYNLLRLLRFALGSMPIEQAQTLIYQRIAPAPGCLSGVCVQLAQDTLSKALVLKLAKSGGWRNERYLRKGEPTAGRIWDRVPLEERVLKFSPQPLAFMHWLTSEKPTDTKEPWDAPRGTLTGADELFFAYALESLRELNDVHNVLSRKTAFYANPFCWLFQPRDFSEREKLELPDFDTLFQGERLAMLECLQPYLTNVWIRFERGKGQITDWRRMRQVSAAEDAFLTAFLAAAQKAARPDLARFVLKTASMILGGTADLSHSYWTGGLASSAPLRLADRIETQRLALTLPRHLEILHRWDQAARRVGYFDEGYAANQLWKADWEAARGDEISAKAKKILEQLDPLRTG